MYEETKSKIDWKGLFLKVIIVFLIVLIGFKGYSTLKGNNDKKITTKTETIAKSKTSSTFSSNLEKLKNAGESYFNNNKEKLPTVDGNTAMVTLNELINNGEIEKLSNEDGKNCDIESSYVTAIREGSKYKIKANLVCDNASSYSVIYMGENATKVSETTTSTKTDNKTVTTSTKTTTNNTTNSCGSACATPVVTVTTNTTVKEEAKKTTDTNKSNQGIVYTADSVTVSFDSNGGSKNYASQRVKIGKTAYNPGSTYKSGYTFIGWYYNGRLYDFSTPVVDNITLYAYYESDDTYYYSSSKNRNSSYHYYDDNTLTTEQRVHSIGWNTYGSQYITVSHTLRMPSILRNSKKIKYVRIKSIEFESPLNTLGYLNIFKNNHANTFMYTKNGWEYNWPSYWNDPDTLATINGYSVRFNYNNSFVSYDQVANYGYDVTWIANSVDKQCRSTFTVNGVSGLCNYGIIYNATWEYIY